MPSAEDTVDSSSLDNVALLDKVPKLEKQCSDEVSVKLVLNTPTGLLPVVRVERGQARVTRFNPIPITTAAPLNSGNDSDCSAFLKDPDSYRPKHFSDSQLNRMRHDSQQAPPSSPALSSGSASRSSQLSVWQDDSCQLCRHQQQRSRDSQDQFSALDEAPPPTKRLPCSCADRRLHLACLETKFADDAVYFGGSYGFGEGRGGGGSRQLRLRCIVCGDAFVVTRRRGRRACDTAARTSFARHFLTVLVISGVLIGFGLWSMLHPVGGKVNIVNAILIGAGSLVVILFVMYELWLLHCRYDFVFTRIRPPREAAGVSLSLTWPRRSRWPRSKPGRSGAAV